MLEGIIHTYDQKKYSRANKELMEIELLGLRYKVRDDKKNIKFISNSDYGIYSDEELLKIIEKEFPTFSSVEQNLMLDYYRSVDDIDPIEFAFVVGDKVFDLLSGGVKKIGNTIKNLRELHQIIRDLDNYYNYDKKD